ncbi:putative exopolysaccharide biosynthesis protein [Hyella patelloides LEGE 07179]|uniref:non-specific protein-tyrosine kinase n=1 Tax=Hyella patelloides LEGE 07179 TaxID=945734 RepID=A0A563VQJ3_9CYAN|nr:polysaccharide biosynthesis tyrosine autokinase [Hyella patelloides]VEP13738.1 putative exopolysaccharide biosynthesis protein [Hyella patelloides LEGE 07179]
MTNNGFNYYPPKELESNYYNLPKSRENLDLDLGQYLLKLKRRWKPAILVFLATLGGSVFLSLFLQNSYQAAGKLLFRQNTAASLTGIGEDISSLDSIGVNETPLKNEIEKITASPVLQETIDQLELTDGEGEPLKPKNFAQNLTVELVGGSDVIEVGYNADRPEIAAEIVNTLMTIYVREQIRNNQAEPANAKEFINRQLPEIEVKVETAESELEQFRTENSIIDLQEEKRTIVQDAGAINRQIATLGASYQGKQAQTKAMQSQLGLNLQQAIAANQLGNTPAVKSTLTELSDTEAAIAKERQRFKDNHPSIVSLQEKKANLRQQLEQSIAETVGIGVEVSDGLLNAGDNNKETILENFINLKIEELSLQQQLSSVSQSQQEYLKRADELPRLEKKEQELMRKADTANKTYTALLESLQQARLAENQQTGNVDIIEEAIAPETGSSGRMALILLGFLSGLFLSNLTAIALEWQDRTVKSIPELKKKLPYKVLGVIPQMDDVKEQGVLVKEEPDSYVSELYRMLQANLKFMNSQRAPKVILVTSSVPGEGKSTITANLAAAIAQLGRYVLLIDGDLRKPTQNTLWKAPKTVGLQDLIRDRKPLANAVHRPMPKLDILFSTSRVSNPLALLDSPEMGELIARGRKTYDLVLIDAPPLPVTADVLTLSKMVDGILFVSRLGVVENESADLAQEALTSIDPNILGMVINGVKSKEFEQYSYSSKYGKRYFNQKPANENDNGNSNGNNNGNNNNHSSNQKLEMSSFSNKIDDL